MIGRSYPFRLQFLVAACCALVSACSSEKEVADAEVRRLCAQDGGIKVYEKVRLLQSRFDEGGEVRVPSKISSKQSDDYYFERETVSIKKGNPEIWRAHYKLIRRVDEKVIGESVSYARRGGDFPGPWHPSSFGCPEKADIKDIAKMVFYK